VDQSKVNTSDKSETALGAGSAGDIRINANVVTLDNLSELNSQTFGPGTAGKIIVDNKSDALGGGSVSLDNSSISSSANGTGAPGIVEIKNGETVSLDTGAKITTTAGASASGAQLGEISIIVGGNVTADNGSRIDARTSGALDAGSITITSANLNASNEGGAGKSWWSGVCKHERLSGCWIDRSRRKQSSGE